MVFSSHYLNPHNNYHQEGNQQKLISITESSYQLQPPQQPPRSIWPGPMPDRAHLAKITQPETPLKCPRCDSTNTKFCYFNNHSLLQPRHFCKTCRRYWTRGGALRNVPVGGGYRRNKRTKNQSKSIVTNDHRRDDSSSAGCSKSSVLPSGFRDTENMLNDLNRVSAQYSQLPFLPPFHMLGGYNSSGISEHFPFLANFETSVIQEHESVHARQDHQLRASSKLLSDINGIAQLGSVKREGNHSLNLENDQIWGGHAWSSSSTDPFGFTSSAANYYLL